MTSTGGQPRRHRSSTAATRGLNTDERSSLTAELISRLSLKDAAADEESLVRITAAADGLRRELETQNSSKDTFRHGKGFESVLQVLNVQALVDEQRPNDYIRMFRGLLLLLSKSMEAHQGNEKYFRCYLNGWISVQQAVEAVGVFMMQTQGPEIAMASMALMLEALLVLALGEEIFDGISTIAGETVDGNHAPKRASLLSYAPSGDESLQNPDALAIAVRLAIRILEGEKSKPGGSSQVSLHVLRLSVIIARSSTRNQVALWQTGLLADLIPLVLADSILEEPKQCLDDLILSLHRLGLPSLDDVALLFQQSSESSKAREVLLKTMEASKTPAFIQFDLSLCGFSSIELPGLPRAFPPTVGYSLTAWIRIDDFDPACHTTLFGAFDASQSCFILAYLEKDSHHLILQTSVRSTRPSVRFKSTRFAIGRWYHIALVHRKNITDPRQSSAVLFVDGEFVDQVKCGYPEPPPEYDEKHAANNVSGPSSQNGRRQKPVQAFFGTPHDLALRLGRNKVKSRWSLASAHLYQAPLSDELVAVHHRLGPRYTGNMQDCLGPLLTYRASAELNRYNELLHPDKSDKSDIITVTEHRGSDVMPEGRLLINICPTAIITFDGPNILSQAVKYDLDRKAFSRYHQLAQKSKVIAINTAIPALNEAISRSYGTGILTGDPVIALPKALDNASWCLAGSIPIFVRLLESATTKSAFLQSVQVFFECIKDNWRISEAMEKGNGFGVLAMIIREKLCLEPSSSMGNTRKGLPITNPEERQSLPLELLQLTLDFVGYDKARPDNSMIVNPMAYRVLLVDFDTWRRCDLETQKFYYTQFMQFVTHNRHQAFNQKRLVRMRVVKKIIEALKSEEFTTDSIPPLMLSMRTLLDYNTAGAMYRELAMFVVFGLQDERATMLKPVRHMASVVTVRQKTAMWARVGRGSRPNTSDGTLTPQNAVARSELAISVLELLGSILCDESHVYAIRRFNKAVPNRWLLHLLAESDVRVLTLTLRILSRSFHVLGSEFKVPFVEKNGGFTTLKSRLKAFWRHSVIWVSAFAILFGRSVPMTAASKEFTVFNLVDIFAVDDGLAIANPEMLPTVMAMLEAGLRHIVKVTEPDESDAKVLKTVIQFLSELYNRSVGFREFAANSRYAQEILFVLYPILVGSDRLAADTELQSDKDSLSFRGEEVKMRPHSNSLGERSTSVRSLNLEHGKRTPSPMPSIRVDVPKRLSSFVLVHGDSGKAEPAQFNPVMSPKKVEPVKMNVGNSIVESLLEVVVSLFLDFICTKKDFSGIGLFLKVPPGFREHQAYFESYVLVHTLTQLWNHLKFNQALFIETKVLTNLSRFCQHLSEAVFEGWFIDGAQPLLDFSGRVLEYLQQPDIAVIKNVRLCSQNINTIRVVFLRVCLWRLSLLDESEDEKEITSFLNQMNYWQTILFSSENQETVFIRLICFLLYIKLVSNVQNIRLAAARLWRTILVQKPMETATLLTYTMGSEQRHLSTGFMRLVSMDDEDFISWIDENRFSLDKVFIDALHKPWDEFVNDENRRTEESARSRLNKRKDKLRQWQFEETSADDFMHRYEISTSHWRSNVHSQERLKLQRANQDHQEYINHLLTVFIGIEKTIQQPSGLQPKLDGTKWQLDETEAVNRMRLRTVPEVTDQNQAFQPKRKMSGRQANGKLTIDTQLGRGLTDNIMSSMPHTPVAAISESEQEQSEPARDQSSSISNSQLLEGGFEMVEDPREADDGLLEDKNRKVLTSLQRGDMVQQLYNTSRIVGLEACEGLLVVGKNCLYLQDNFFQRSDGEILSVAQAPDDERDPYVQLISGKDIGAQRTKHSMGDQETRHWTWTEVLSISKRRFLFRDVAAEVFFTDGRSYLLTCMSTKVRDDLYNAVLSRAPHVHSPSGVASEDTWRLDTLRNPEEGPQSFGSKFASVFNSMPSHAATKKWMRGEMSNFQYLMLVNTMAGRTFNDLTQYPVFPWVLADYSSEDLDLSNPKTFRNFSKPMGCQTEAREAEYKDRFRQFSEMGDLNAPPFHYGTHYSSAMIVSSYLIRLQPFVQSYLLLQGGSFDHADRLFDSIERAWLSCSRDNMTDVRELTPEFFYLPEFLVNVNEYDFGAKQGSGETVNNVKLPRWAKGDPHVFIAKHREALESPYVSQHLHDWIDLVFGYKQRGETAIEATNVFQHLSYQGAKDLDSIDDPVERLASIGIIHSFGQTPHQVFQKPHPSREHVYAAVSRLDSLAESLIKLPDPLFESDEKVTGLTFSASQERLMCAGPCKLNLLPNLDRYMQWGFADHSLRFFSANTKRPLGLNENMHVGPIIAATFADSKTLVTAGADCTIGLWTVTSTSRDSIDVQPKTYLFGHRSAVVILAASRVFSTLLSASTDGKIVIWGLNRQQSIRILHPVGEPAIQAARISNVNGHILICQGQHVLLYTLNGHLLVRQKVCESEKDRLTCCAFYEGAANEWLERELIFTGHTYGVVNVWTLTTLGDGAWYMQLVKRLHHTDHSREDGGNSSAAITAILPMPQAVYTGDEDGRVWQWDCVVRHSSLSARGR